MTSALSTAAPQTSTTDLPTDLYVAEQVRQLDRCAIEDHGVAGIYLMKRAGRAAFDALLERWSEPEAVTVIAGTGNNGGDGYVVAALAAQRRIPVTVYYVAEPEKLQGDARAAYEFARREGVIMQPFSECKSLSASQGVVVDAMLGTGLKGEVREPYAQAIRLINASGLPVVALDLPSGLCADTGRSLGETVKAQLTVTFIGVKQGLLTGRGPAMTGELRFADLNVPLDIYKTQTATTQRLRLADLLERLPERDQDAHKGSFGHVMVIGGDHGYAGAALMAAEAAARLGSGLTSVATQPEHVSAMIARRPELMVMGVPSGQALEPLLERPTVLVMGPGLGQTPWSEQMLQQAAKTGLPMIIDADALNLLAAGRVLPNAKRDNWILTPHPGEAARLLDCTTEEVQADRFAAVAKLQERFGGTVILKGAGTLVATAGQVSLANVGNPGMATGGMGDVLSGVLGALLAQGLDAMTSAQLGVCLHGDAADLAVQDDGVRGLLPTDLLPYLRQLLNGVR